MFSKIGLYFIIIDYMWLDLSHTSIVNFSLSSEST